MLTILQDPMFDTQAWMPLDPITLQPPQGSAAFQVSPLETGPQFATAAPVQNQPAENQYASLDPGTVGINAGLNSPGTLGVNSGGPPGLLGNFSDLIPTLFQGAVGLGTTALTGNPWLGMGASYGVGKAMNNGKLPGILNMDWFNSPGVTVSPNATPVGQQGIVDAGGGIVGVGDVGPTAGGVTPGHSVNLGHIGGVGLFDADGGLVGIEGYTPADFDYFTDPNYGGGIGY